MHTNQYILRGYEYYGNTTEISIGDANENVQGVQLGDRVDILERPIDNQSHSIEPWTIASFKLVRP